MRLITTIAVLGVALVGAAVSTAASERPRTIVLYSETTSYQVTDKAPKGPSAGDTTRETSRLRNAVAQLGKTVGAVVGRDRATSVLVSKTRWRVNGVAYLPGGTLTFRGLSRRHPQGGFEVPVVAGTGLYAGAHGLSRVMQIASTKRVVNAYVLEYRPTA